jgi:hypothetical protein
MIVICFSRIIFLIEIFYLSNLVLYFLLLFILFEIIYKIIIFFNFIIFQLSYPLDLISIILIVIYFI